METLTTQEQRKIKDHFEQRVNKQSRKAMIDFLTGHFRYHTMNSWNRCTSYAHCIKLHMLRLPLDIKETMYDMVFCDEWSDRMSSIMQTFDHEYDNYWQVRTNGRSGGYIVLYSGGANKNGIISLKPGKSIDQDEDFFDWDKEDLLARVNMISDFDRLVSDIVIDFAAFCRTYDVVDKKIMVPKTVQVLKEKQHDDARSGKK